MTQRRTGLVALAACALAVWASLGAVGRADDEPSITVRAFREPFIRGGDPRHVLVTVASLDPTLTVSLDPAGVANDGFVRRLPPSEFTFCPIDRGRVPCPPGHRCFGNTTLLELQYRLVRSTR